MFDFNAAAPPAGLACSSWDTNWSNTCNFDVWFMYSDNGGSTWSTAGQPHLRRGQPVDHFLGYMRVDEADGSIYLCYHRSRLNPAARPTASRPTTS